MIAIFPRPCQGNSQEEPSFWIFLSWQILEHFRILGESEIIFEWGFLQLVTRSIAHVIHNARVTEIHSSPKEMQLSYFLEKFSFVILWRWHGLKDLKTVREPWMILEWVFGNCSQEHCRSHVWPKVHWHTIFSKRNATLENLSFFWRRV